MTNAELIKKLRTAADDIDEATEFASGQGNKRLEDSLIVDAAMHREAADALVDLEAKLANAERRAEDAETRNDFLLSEIDEIIKRERQKS